MEKYFTEIYSRISRAEKSAFFSALVFGFITHIHIFSINYIFHDSVTLDNLGYTYSSGRWALGVLNDLAARILGAYQLPFINGFISLLFIALTALIIVRAFELQSRLTAAFIGVSLVSFPSVASHFAFMFTAPAYFFSMLLSAGAVVLVHKRPNAVVFAFSMFLIAFSIGIYQAYLSFAASLAVFLLIVEGLRHESAFSCLMKKALLLVSMLICGLIVYLVINKLVVWFKGIELTTYQGLHKIGRIDWHLMPKAIYQAYYDQFNALWFGIISSFFEQRLTILITVLGSIMFICLLWGSKASSYAKFFLLFLAAIAPLATNSVYLMSPRSMGGVHALMRMSLCFTYILPAVLCELLYEKRSGIIRCYAEKLLVGSLIVVLCLVPAVFCYRNNTAYLNAELAEEQAEAYLGSMVTRIRSAEGYSDDLPVAYIGFGITDSTLDRLPTFGKIYTYVLSFSLEEMLRTDLWEEFCALHLGWAPTEVEDISYYEELEQVQQMPCYPDSGSIKVIDNAIVVKFSD